ncbi:hypothetical protein AM593_03464, partial [Mytilus galloprovincialis]
MIFLGIYQPIADETVEVPHQRGGDGNPYRPYHDIDRSSEGHIETASTPRVMEDSRLTS